MDKVHGSGAERQFQNLLECEEYLPGRYRNSPTEFEKDGHHGVDFFAPLGFFDALLDGDPMSIGLACGLGISLLGIVSHESIEYNGEWVEIPDSREW